MSHAHDHAAHAHHADGHGHHHHDEHDRGHAHDHAHGGLGGHHHHGSGRVLLFSLCFTLVFAVVELIGGWVSGSLALMSDAGHMFTDSTSLAIGAGAAWLARRPASRAHSYGLQRAEVLGALFNAVLMIVVVVMIAASAVQRLFEPEPVAGATVLVIAALGLCVNLVIGFILLRGEQTLNVRGALLHVMGDLAGSVAALAAGLVILLTGWVPIDAILSLFVSGLIALSAVPLMRDVTRVLMEGVPKDVDTDDVHEALVAVGGVQAVHDLHVWTLSSRQRALSAHVEIARLDDWDDVLPHLQAVLAERFSISHSTLQPESRDTARACRLDSCCKVRTA